MRTLVVKYGGSVRDEPTFLLEEIAYFATQGMQIVVVHGGGPEITHYLTQLGLSSRFEQGLRVTDADTLDVVEMVLCGRAGKRIVRSLQAHGARAVGISGEDGGLIRSESYGADQTLGFVGRVAAVDVAVLNSLMKGGFLPVVAPLGVDADGQVRNINADFVAGAIAAALHAEAFVLATDVPGVKESTDSLHPIADLSTTMALALIDQGVVTGGMIPKLQATIEAVSGGAHCAYIVDGRQAGTITAIVQGEVRGTRIMAGVERGVRHA